MELQVEAKRIQFEYFLGFFPIKYIVFTTGGLHYLLREVEIDLKEHEFSCSICSSEKTAFNSSVT